MLRPAHAAHAFTASVPTNEQAPLRRALPPNWDALHQAVTGTDIQALKKGLNEIEHLSPEHANALLRHAYQYAVGEGDKKIEADIRKLIFIKALTNKENNSSPQDWLDQSVKTFAHEKGDAFIARFTEFSVSPSPIESLPLEILRLITQELDLASAVNMLLAVPIPTAERDALIEEMLTTKNAQGKTSFDDAIQRRDSKLVTALCALLGHLSNAEERDAQIRSFLTTKNSQGETPVGWAIAEAEAEADSKLVKSLCELLGHLSNAEERDAQIRYFLTTKNSQGETPIGWAIAVADSKLVKSLCELLDRLPSADERDGLITDGLEKKNNRGHTPLDIALTWHLFDREPFTAIGELLGHLPKPEARDRQIQKVAMTKIKSYLASPVKKTEQSEKPVIEYAMERVDRAKRDNERITALGALLGRLSNPEEKDALIRLMLMTLDDKGRTQLHEAIDDQDNERITALGALLGRMSNAEARNTLIVEMLMIGDAQGRSPLMEVASSGSNEMIAAIRTLQDYLYKP
jgi:hypothetical protein